YSIPYLIGCPTSLFDAYNLFTDYATIEYLDTYYLTAESIKNNYLTTDYAWIGEEFVTALYAETGFIEVVIAEDGTYTGTLHAVTFEADSIYANSIVLKGEDGLFYKLNTDGVTVSAEQTEYNSLSGTILIAQSVSADKIYVTDLYAFDATIGGFIIDEDAIRSEAKGTIDATTTGIYMDNKGQFNFGDSSSYVKGYYDEDGNYKLEISVESLYMSTGKNIADALDELSDGLEKVVVKTTISYGQSDSSTTEPTECYETCPELEEGTYIWLSIVVTYGDGSEDSTVSCIGAEGKDNVITSDTEPEDTSKLWLDTSSVPYVLKTYSSYTYTISESVLDDEGNDTGEVIETEVTEEGWYEVNDQSDTITEAMNSVSEVATEALNTANEVSGSVDELSNSLTSTNTTVNNLSNDLTAIYKQLGEYSEDADDSITGLSIFRALEYIYSTLQLTNSELALTFNSMFKVVTGGTYTYIVEEASEDDYTVDDDGYLMTSEGVYIYDENGNQIIATTVYEVIDATIDISDDNVVSVQEGSYTLDGLLVYTTTVIITSTVTSTVTTTDEETGEEVEKEVLEDVSEEVTYTFCYVDVIGAIENIEALESLTTEMQSVVSHIILGDDNGTPYISLSTSESDFSLRITNDQISFIEGDNTVAYISDNKLWITEAEVDTMTINSELNLFNNFSWININGYFVLVKEDE
ncbi:MAG: hypothetical protein LUF02_09060, partial [Erysipelotrichaceae bacterium]|nr:hypothetical protein [Erysipelotrichaceae bacterium]